MQSHAQSHHSTFGIHWNPANVTITLLLMLLLLIFLLLYLSLAGTVAQAQSAVPAAPQHAAAVCFTLC